MKHILIALGNSKLNTTIEEQLSKYNAYPMHTLTDFKKLQPAVDFLDPDVLLVSSNFQREQELIPVLEHIRNNPSTSNVEILFFTQHANPNDSTRYLRLGKLIDTDVYPVFNKKLLPEIVLDSLNNPPELSGEVKRISDSYHQFLDEKKESQKIQSIKDSKENKIDNIVTFAASNHNIGTTFMATNYAMELAQLNDDKIALIDGNTENSHLANTLGLGLKETQMDKARVDLRDYIKQVKLLKENENTKELEQKLSAKIEKYFVQLPAQPNLYILAHSENMRLTDAEMEILLTIVSKLFNRVVVDGGLIYNKTLLSKSDAINIVATMNNNNLKDTLNMSQNFKQHNVQNKVHYILNRYNDRIDNVKLTFDKKLLKNYGLNVITTIPDINENIMFNDLFANTLLVNGTSQEAENFRSILYKLIK